LKTRRAIKPPDCYLVPGIKTFELWKRMIDSERVKSQVETAGDAKLCEEGGCALALWTIERSHPLQELRPLWHLLTAASA
jgi:hypothetical protein